MSEEPIERTEPRLSDKLWNVSLWAVQLLLAALFTISGIMKLTTPMPELAANLGWPGDLPAGLVRFIGLAELAGALGVVLPSVTRIRPGLTPMAAAGLLMIMVLAAGFHLTRGEGAALPFVGGLGALAAVVVWGRLRRVPIAPR